MNLSSPIPPASQKTHNNQGARVLPRPEHRDEPGAQRLHRAVRARQEAGVVPAPVDGLDAHALRRRFLRKPATSPTPEPPAPSGGACSPVAATTTSGRAHELRDPLAAAPVPLFLFFGGAQRRHQKVHHHHDEMVEVVLARAPPPGGRPPSRTGNCAPLIASISSRVWCNRVEAGEIAGHSWGATLSLRIRAPQGFPRERPRPSTEPRGFSGIFGGPRRNIGEPAHERISAAIPPSSPAAPWTSARPRPRALCRAGARVTVLDVPGRPPRSPVLRPGAHAVGAPSPRGAYSPGTLFVASSRFSRRAPDTAWKVVYGGFSSPAFPRARARPCPRAPPPRGNTRTGCDSRASLPAMFHQAAQIAAEQCSRAGGEGRWRIFSSTRRVEISGYFTQNVPPEAAAGVPNRASPPPSARPPMRAGGAAGPRTPHLAQPRAGVVVGRVPPRSARRPSRTAEDVGEESSRARRLRSASACARPLPAGAGGEEPGIVLAQHPGAGPGRRDDVVERLERLDGALRDRPVRCRESPPLYAGWAAAGLDGGARPTTHPASSQQPERPRNPTAGTEEIDEAGDEQPDPGAGQVRRREDCRALSGTMEAPPQGLPPDSIRQGEKHRPKVALRSGRNSSPISPIFVRDRAKDPIRRPKRTAARVL